MSKRVVLIIVLASVLGLGIYLSRDWIERQFFRPTGSSIEDGVGQVRESDSDVGVDAKGLEVPWEVVQLPDGDLLVTERPGRLQRISGMNSKTHEIVGVQHVGEGGLMGLALHPDYASNKYIYLYLTSRSGEGLINRIERYTLDDDELVNRTVVLNNIPGASNHDGGRIAFGPDGKLYVTTGDAGQQALAQNKNSLAGKILRLNDDGSPPNDNPFGNLVYSYGHRNPQGIAWDNEGRLWSTEHGPSGAGSGFDELNLITKGGNYGWPTIKGDETRDGMIRPVAHSGGDETWAPAGLAYHDGSLFFSGLRGESLYEATIESESSVKLKAHFRGFYGRLRAVTVIGDRLYVTTSNRDGRGNLKPGDDKVIWHSFKLLQGE